MDSLDSPLDDALPMPAPDAPPAAPRDRRAAFAWLLALALCGCRGDQLASAPAFDPDSIPDAYAASTAALMWPGSTRAFQIRPDGDLYNGDWLVRFDARGDGRSAGPPKVIAFEERWRPIAHWRRWSGRLRWDFEALALPVPGSGDSNLVVSLEARVTNTADRPLEPLLTASLTAPDSAPPFIAADAADTVPALRWGSAATSAPVCAFSPQARSGEPRIAPGALAPGAAHATRFLFPAYPTPARALAAWAGVPHERRANEARRYWGEALARGTRFDLGDPDVQRALDAARVTLLACREKRGGRWLPIGAPLHYRDVWLRDGARAIAALASCGYSREARDLADGLLLLQWPMGAFLSQRGQLDGTGQALWALAQAGLRPAAGVSIGRFADAALGAFHWLQWQREFARASGWPLATLLPFGDPRDNEQVRAQLVGNDAWALAGYRAAERLLRAAGRTAEADSVEIARGSYLADFERALSHCGSNDIPPSWQGVGRDWGNLSVAWPCGALSPGNPRCAALADRIWASAGGPGLCTYGGRDSLHCYLGADLGTWALLAGRREAADRVLGAMLRWRSASGGAGEIVARDGGYGANLPPHATSAAALVQLVRNALVFDDGDTLQLTLGARERWWRGARVGGAPTRWGSLDVAFGRDAGHAQWSWTPVPVWTALTLPPGARLARAPGAPLLSAGSGTVVLAPPGTRGVRVDLMAASR